MSKPTFSNTRKCSNTSAFFFACGDAQRLQAQRTAPMNKSSMTMAQKVAQAASAFEERRSGHAPRSVTVVLSEETLVITLHGVLSPAERALAKSPEGAAQVQEFHRQLFLTS